MKREITNEPTQFYLDISWLNAIYTSKENGTPVQTKGAQTFWLRFVSEDIESFVNPPETYSYTYEKFVHLYVEDRSGRLYQACYHATSRDGIKYSLKQHELLFNSDRTYFHIADPRTMTQDNKVK